MGKRKKREPGPQRHAEGQHGDRTHKRFIEMLHQPGGGAGVEGTTDGGDKSDRVLSDARIPHEGDSD